MQKKLIALAIAGLASSAAFAQSSVQIYGAIDMGYSHRGDSFLSGVDSQNAIDSGISDGNRLGFKGSEDLGNGLKALFTLETGFLTDTGLYDGFAGGGVFTRQAVVGLSSDSMGTVLAGRMFSPQYAFLTALDPFGEGTVGTYLNTVGNDVSAGLTVIPRLSNAVSYISPTFSGFNVTAVYSSHGDVNSTQDRVGNSDNNNRVYGVLPRYTNGPIDIGLNFHRIDFGEDTGLGLDDLRNWTLGGSYDFEVVKLAAFYADTKIAPLVGDDLKIKSWMVGATVPFGRHAVKVSYNQSKAEQGSLDGTSKQWALGYNYSLSKRTSLYTAFAQIDNDREANDLVRSSAANDASNDATVGGYQNGFNVGVMHTF
ncbi:MAG: porin [Azovibrio sp.]|uniref:porin n=1 Tax=Azovibrio sp. TaxID=1872673 RepID=UPI003C742563